ncbi:NfeD family protein [Maridesulfovibrio sp.]|uniref:NfeD family protein n=1 Tax=Maridesulfovibrio sp. TaxID=2795000 RepID=UPI0029CA54E9|nr:NfeD family protein [Maridesulfovibrio sp.]
MNGFPLWLIWLGAGLALALLELAAPGMILIFFSFGCLLAASVAYFFSEALTLQVVTFCVASVISLLVLRRLFISWFQGQISETESDGYEDGPKGALAEACKDFSADGYGQIKYRGSYWKAVSDSGYILAAGDKVRIIDWTDKSKTTFLVKKI